MNCNDKYHPKDSYIGFRAPRRLARALLAMAQIKGVTVSQFLRELVARTTEAA